jgi:hypothetical protein
LVLSLLYYPLLHSMNGQFDRVIMYYIETKTICSHPHFGQFLGSHLTWRGGGGRYFCRFYLAVFNAVLLI